MIVSCITDRMGNQLFQYAAAKALAVRNKEVVKIDRRYYSHNIPTGFSYELDAFCIPQYFVTDEEIARYTWPNDSLWYRAIRKVYPKYCYFEKSFEYDKGFNTLGSKVYLRGFWQSYKYFEDIKDLIRNEFSFKEQVNTCDDHFAKQINESESVCISIRRGDHITNPKIARIFGKCDKVYYDNALRIIEQKHKNLTLFVFSDDIDWCSENLKFKHPIVFVKHSFDTPRYDYYLQLMSMCRHFVIPVSTFPWWGAWLSTNKDKIVIAPKTWFNDPAINTQDLCPPDWIRI